MNRKSVLFLLNLLFIFVLAGDVSNAQNRKASTSNPSAEKSVVNTNDLFAQRWNLIEINGLKIEKTAPFIEFDSTENSFAGNAGCNRMFGRFEAIGNTIKFSGIGATKKFCSAEGVMKLENEFVKALEQATGFELKDNSLRIFAKNNLILKFSSAKNDSGKAISDISKLEDKKWVLVSIGGKNLPKIEKTPFLIFNKQQTSAGGDSGCNAYGGSYKIEGDKISITGIVSTMRACIEGKRMNVERDLLDGLKKINRFEIKAGKLILYQGSKSLLVFDAATKT
ncbi:MAG TPA: META domain-containing protein [Pyrinomonadaceae bacterium]|jgi:heat shock protein HslJ